MQKISLYIVLLCLFTTAQTGDLASEQAKLNSLNQEIKSLNEALEYDASRQQQFQTMLRELDIKIGELAPALQESNKQIINTQANLHLLKQEQEQAKQDLIKQQLQLRDQIRNAYLTQQSSLLKQMLTPATPQDFGRLVHYYRYFNLARQTEIEKIETDLSKIASRECMIEEKLAELKNLQQEQLRQYEQLQAKQKRREALLTELNKDIASKDNKISQLKEDASGLNKIIARLEKKNKKATSQQIAELKGNLLWPTTGELLHTFGKPRNDERVRWSGIFIRNAEGEPVKAVHPGRVIYADWLRGYGLLLIVEHGDDYMSLYAYNQSLQKKPGDWVSANETIALVGKSGGMPDPGLYFEIRHAGSPIDPLAWIQQQS